MESQWRMLLLGPWFWEEILSSFLVSWFNKGRLTVSFFQIPMKMQLKKVNLGSRLQETIEEEEKPCLLDLPELALECILERLSPAGLCRMAGVCSSLRDRCRSDHLWEKHLKQKWGRVIGDSAYKEWQWHTVSRKRTTLLDHRNQKGSFGSLCSVWPLSWFVKPKCEIGSTATTSLPADSIMAFYLSLESGKFWFPAQVYNRENGHVGFLLSCYDAQLSYDSKTDIFQARYSPFARRTIEQSIRWDRIRAPPIDNPAHVLHISECLNDLKPGDHIEIQWRRSKEFPYGWWYAVVSHLESCDGNENRCRCQYNDTVILEFNQYTPGSRWRQTIINRKDHREEGNEADGFYGGIRKLNKEEEIARWKRLWPNQQYD